MKNLGQSKKEEFSFRKIFILQLVGLVLTYDFTNCDFTEIKKEYCRTIREDLLTYMSGTKSTEFNTTIFCNNRSHCLTEIQRLTFNPTAGCAPLAKELFVLRTNATLALWCPGYSETQINATQAMKKRKKRKVTTNKCLEQVSQLPGLWRRFIRTLRKQ
uniref:Thymic stromal lymphopoietin n=2 Tax=Cebus imitator TaxID=2715852 RepID=A0A2K5Q1I7_CEBIM